VRRGSLIQRARRSNCHNGSLNGYVDMVTGAILPVGLRASICSQRDSTSRSTSSASTARPETPTNESSPATKTHSGRKKISVPKLLQDHSEVADPNTPAHSHGDTREDVEADGALDLEELGLVDKEIPVEQIQKGDKIGSGGFKE
jgi:hypothetical protein